MCSPAAKQNADAVSEPLCAAACRIVKKGENSYTVTYRAGKDGPEQTMDVGLVMMATGRHPRVESLNLQVKTHHQQPGLTSTS
jgi:pyruvate/2-oxoglutarate dehydrogenase complex dihydrolipoamide dehydrogenase (E3) component